MRETYYDIPANQTLTLIEGASFEVSIELENQLVCPADSWVVSSSHSGTEYQWNGIPGDSTMTFTEPGSYVLDVLLSNGIWAQSDTIHLSHFDQLTAEIDLTPVSCNEGNDGSILVWHPLGVDSIIWNDFDHSLEYIDSLSAGSYAFNWMDTNGCWSTSEAHVSDGELLQGSVNVTHSIEGLDNGISAVVMENGLPPFNYEWSNGCSSFICQNLAPGEYNVLVTDANECDLFMEFEVESIVSVDEVSSLEDVLSVMPNPFKDEIKIQSRTAEAVPYRVRILSSTGSLILEKEMHSINESISTSLLAEGMYFVVIQSNQDSWRLKMVKE